MKFLPKKGIKKITSTTQKGMNLKVIGYKIKQLLVSKLLAENLGVANPCMNRFKLTANKYNFVIIISLNRIYHYREDISVHFQHIFR